MVEKDAKIKKNRLYVINIIMFVYIFCLSVGYAFFSDSLTINGVASTVDYYSGENLPAAPIVRDPENNRYFTVDETKSNLDFMEERWEEDTYILKYNKKFGIVAGKKTMNYTISFTNPTALPYTNGTVTTEYIENDNNYIKEISASISKTELKPGETVDITFTVTFNFLADLGDQEVKATVTYMLQNEPKTINFVIFYD